LASIATEISWAIQDTYTDLASMLSTTKVDQPPFNASKPSPANSI